MCSVSEWLSLFHRHIYKNNDKIKTTIKKTPKENSKLFSFNILLQHFTPKNITKQKRNLLINKIHEAWWKRYHKKGLEHYLRCVPFKRNMCRSLFFLVFIKVFVIDSDDHGDDIYDDNNNEDKNTSNSINNSSSNNDNGTKNSSNYNNSANNINQK